MRSLAPVPISNLPRDCQEAVRAAYDTDDLVPLVLRTSRGWSFVAVRRRLSTGYLRRGWAEVDASGEEPS